MSEPTYVRLVAPMLILKCAACGGFYCADRKDVDVSVLGLGAPCSCVSPTPEQRRVTIAKTTIKRYERDPK